MRSISGEFPLQTDTEATTARRGASDLRRAGWSCAVGSAMEYYDFALYAMASSFIFGPVFFPTGGKFSGLIASFATYFVGFAVRPLGGLYFGRLGDLYGRKLVLMLTITLMGISSTAIGLIPSYATIGIAAPVLLVLMRVLQGFGAGAEQAGASVMMAEYAPEGRRGFFASIPLIGVQIGMAVATMVYLVTFFASHETVLNWAWRVPFLCGAVILAVALYMRLALKESPAFRGVVDSHHQEKLSLTGFFRKCRRPILIGMGLRLAENGGSSIFQALAIGYLEKVMGVPMFAAASLLLIANMFGIPSILAAGFLSDRFGRVKIYRRAAFAQAVLAFPAWYAFSTGNIVLAGIGLCAGLIANTMMYGSQAALLAEMFGVGHRYGGVAVTREFSAVFSGGIAPLIGATIISWVAERHADLTHAGSGAWVYLAAYLAAMSVLTFAVTFIMRDPINRSLQASEDFC